MDEYKIDIAKKDTRVKNENILMKKINMFSAVPRDNLKGIVIYCHGLGSNKNMVIRFCDRLLENNLGIYAFDFPGHGKDKTDFSQFTLGRCIDYLNKVISYVKKQHHVPIYLFGCSFGGFVILNRLLEKKSLISKILY